VLGWAYHPKGVVFAFSFVLFACGACSMGRVFPLCVRVSVLEGGLSVLGKSVVVELAYHPPIPNSFL